MTEGAIRILLAEDNPADALLTSRALKQSKFDITVQIVADGVEVMDFLSATGKHREHDKNELPRLIILDLKMPRMGGLEVLKHIREEPATQEIPVIIFTSSSQDADIQESRQLGANDYVIKPIDLTEYTTAIQYAIEKWF